MKCLDVWFCVLTDFSLSLLLLTVNKRYDSYFVLWCSYIVYNLSFVPENWGILLGRTYCLVDGCLGQQNIISSRQGVQQAWDCLSKCASSLMCGKLANNRCCCCLLMPSEEVPFFFFFWPRSVPSTCACSCTTLFLSVLYNEWPTLRRMVMSTTAPSS